ncbi:hypothetical protein LNV09_20690 [Paucibacter sp. B2R-40]|uniref:BPSL0761 family protein n=1 Tax=Paucibacter sp. B2R-40 TaxID=2893554 RepID=UPI0021E4114A|nr:BPSL0761 family protein [Paucibacter sp. B2R-40]MCV2356566.1 hypothetical protein [Paucibacter sp. B2R-40]
MTVPHERMRALRWGAELLPMIEQDDSVPTLFRVRAALVQINYPQPLPLLEIVLTDAPAMPLVWAQAIDDARQLFDDLMRSGLGRQETRHLLRFTRRHFAEHFLLGYWTLVLEGVSLKDWLLPERDW